MTNLISTIYHSFIVPYWPYIVSALGLSGLLQAAKHFFLKKLSTKATMSLTTGVAFVANLVQYLTTQLKANPTVLGARTVTLLGAMTLAYRYVIDPAYKLLLDAKQYRQDNPGTVSTTTISSTPTPATVTVTTGEQEASF